MADVGYAATLLTCLASLYTAMAYLLGKRFRVSELLVSARNGVWTSAAMATLASGALFYLLARRDFGIRYVYEHVSSFQPLLYNLSAFWAGQEGSLLLWLWLLCLFAAVVLLTRGPAFQELKPHTLAILTGTQAFFAFLLLVLSNPFARFLVPPQEGFGLNPLLQNVGMVVHPPVVFAGYAGFSVPFALAMAALAAGRFDRQAVRAIRPWLLGSWLLLGMGILIGGWWAYQELGWGGYWGWDPVENSSLVPWLVATAALHASMLQERRGSFRVWNAALMALSFVLCLFATFVTRSGVLQSVHAFGRSAMGWYFAAFILATLSLTAWLLYRQRDALGNGGQVDDLLSREGGFFMTVLLFLGVAAAVFLGTVYPALVELVWGQQVALDATFYNRVFGPLALLLVLTLGVCPALFWGRTPPARLLARLRPGLAGGVLAAVAALAFGAQEAAALVGLGAVGFALGTVLSDMARTMAARCAGKGGRWLAGLQAFSTLDRRRWAAHLVHLGVLIIAAGLVGSSLYKVEHHVVVAPGEEVSISGYTLRYMQPLRAMDQARQRTGVALDVSRSGRPLGILIPERNFYWNVGQVVSEVAIRSSWNEDLYVVLAALQEDDLATLEAQVTPLVSWLWAGGGVLLLGTLASLWPKGKRGAISAANMAASECPTPAEKR
ncbi:MAG: heme lyase CcmF/NrfE family subunit [Anaerolineae bacterium]